MSRLLAVLTLLTKSSVIIDSVTTLTRSCANLWKIVEKIQSCLHAQKRQPKSIITMCAIMVANMRVGIVRQFFYLRLTMPEFTVVAMAQQQKQRTAKLETILKRAKQILLNNYRR